jgi:hypothetical protein
MKILFQIWNLYTISLLLQGKHSKYKLHFIKHILAQLNRKSRLDQRFRATGHFWGTVLPQTRIITTQNPEKHKLLRSSHILVHTNRKTRMDKGSALDS